MIREQFIKIQTSQSIPSLIQITQPAQGIFV